MFFPKKSLGQNFLIDHNILKKIVKIISPTDNDKIIEIGPGQGALTGYLANRCDTLLTVEKDRELAFFIKKNLNVEVILTDALYVPWSRINGKFNKVVGNLPYNISTTLIWDLTSQLTDIDIMVFTVQREVAEKIGSRVGEKKYGPISVWVQTFCDVKLEFLINPNCFYPRPKVMSQVISLKPKKIFLDNYLKKRLSSTLKICFNSPRKQIKNLLKGYWGWELKALFEKRGLRGHMRPNMLSVEDYIEISQVIF